MSSVESTHDTLRPEHDKSPAKEFGSYYALAKELASSDPNQAITYYRKALAIDAGDPWVHYDLGILLLEQTRLEAAQKEFLAVTVLEPTYHWTYQHLGDIAVQYKQSDVAQKYYLKAIELAEQNHATGDCLWTCYKLAKELEDSDIRQAINYYQKALTLNKGYPWIHYDFGVFLAKQNHLGRAQEEFLKVAELEPNYYGTYQHLGDIAFQQNQSEDAEAFYLKGIELAEQHDAQADCFWIYYKLAKEVEGLNAERANQYYQHALALNEKYPWIHYDFGVFLAKQGNLEVARQAFSQVVELESNCYWAYYYLGDLAFQAKQWREAATFYMKAAELALEDKANQDSKFAVNIYFEAVRNLRLLDDLDDAKRVCQKILTLDSEHYQTYCELADILKYQGRLKQACEVYRNLLAIKQDFVWGHNLLGDTLTQLKQIQEARLCYKSALRYEILESKPYLHASVDGFLGKPAKPQFMVIGFAKCGTTSLYRYLVKHPKILPTAKKEIMFFSENYDKGMSWYLDHFPSIPDNEPFITGEASAHYIDHPEVCDRLVKAFPDLKLIILIRNPIERAISDYQMWVRQGFEKRTLGKAMTMEMARVEAEQNFFFAGEKGLEAPSYISSSVYYGHIERWMTAFPAENILILKTDDFSNYPEKALNDAFNFLEIGELKLDKYPRHNSGSYTNKVEDHTYRAMQQYFTPYNKALEDILGDRIDTTFLWN